MLAMAGQSKTEQNSNSNSLNSYHQSKQNSILDKFEWNKRKIKITKVEGKTDSSGNNTEIVFYHLNLFKYGIRSKMENEPKRI